MNAFLSSSSVHHYAFTAWSTLTIMPVELTCDRCGDKFEVSPSRADSARFCSRQCANRRHVEGDPEPIECESCGEEFTVSPSEADTAKYCSVECSRTGEYRTCPECGVQFWTTPSKDHEHCSKECADKARRFYCTCEFCGEEFQGHTSNPNRFCSRECQFKARYEDSLVRAECEECGDTFEMQRGDLEWRRREYDSVYCSRQCAQEGRKTGKYRECVGCGEQFYLPKWRVERDADTGEYCSMKCFLGCEQIVDWKKRERACDYCGDAYLAKFDPDTGEVRERFCSQSCYWASLRPQGVDDKPILRCRECGKTFSVSPSRVGYRRFCSSECRDEALRTPFGRDELEGHYTMADVERMWHKQGGRCFWCGTACGSAPSEWEFHVDHLTPASRKDLGATNWPKNLAIACPECNHKKSDMLPIEFKLRRLRRGEDRKTFHFTTAVGEEVPSLP
jgi:5-methylcytosine-specific restriction endonuclease McrA